MWVTTLQAAEMLGCTVSGIKSMIRTQELIPLQGGTREGRRQQYRFRATDVESVAKKRQANRERIAAEKEARLRARLSRVERQAQRLVVKPLNGSHANPVALDEAVAGLRADVGVILSIVHQLLHEWRGRP